MRRTISLVLALTVAAAVAPQALDAYPERPVKFIIPWAAGGDTDAIKRLFANLLQKYLVQTVVVTNITGASGTVGAREAKNAPPDGYTLYSTHDYIHSTYYTGVSDVNYTDFEPICLATSTPSILTASPKTKWSSWQELVADAKARPGQITVGATLGSTSHFFPALIEREAKIKFKYVSYEGLAPRMNALLGGHIDLGESNLTQKAKVEAGQLRFLAIATEKRSSEASSVPTLKEVGVNVVYAINRGMVAPKGTPEAILAKLEESCAKVARDPAFAEGMRKQGTEVRYLDRKKYAEFLKQNDALNKELARELGLLKR